MHHKARVGVIAALGAAALALPATAVAATTTVYAGLPPGVTKLVAKLHATAIGADSPDVNAFVNQRATVHVGDKVSFLLRGFHTIDLPKKGGGDVPLITPSGGLVSGINDSAGTPFWFNGHVPNIGFNPALFKASGGKVYNGSARLDSGLPLGPPKPYVITFTKAGTYKYYCDVHPGMVGFVTVKPKSATIPTAKQNAAAQLKQLTAAIKTAVKVAKATVPGDTISVGKSGPGGVELFSMFPSTLTVNTGTVVTFTMSKRSFETHTATFGTAAELKKLANAFAGGPQLPPQGAFPSDPTQPIVETPTNHGDGFANTGVLDNDPSTATIPSSGKIQFNAPGTYNYICLVHPFMHGTIIVR